MLKRLTLITAVILCASAIMNAQEKRERPVRKEGPERVNIPLEDFFRQPERTDYSISPSGQYLALLMPVNGYLNLHVMDGFVGKPECLSETHDAPIHDFIWVNDNVLVYTKDQNGDENYTLTMVMRDGSKSQVLSKQNVRVNIICRSQIDKNVVFIESNERNMRDFDVYAIDVANGSRRLVLENPGGFSNWVFNQNDELLSATRTIGSKSTLIYRASSADKWQDVLGMEFTDSVVPFFLSPDGTQLYCTSNLGRDKAAAVAIDVKRKVEAKVIFEHPNVDVDRLMQSYKTKDLMAASFVNYMREYEYFTSDVVNVLNEVRSSINSKNIEIVSMNDDESKFIVLESSDVNAGTYHYYDSQSKELHNLSSLMPWLNPEHLAPVEVFSYPTSDGLKINGYLTYPVGEFRANLPLVVIAHDGPSSRDVWEFNPEVQFLANRGYAVLQVNYRGSKGYGKAFWTAGFKNWGQSMQNDLTEAVQHLIKKGVVNPKRVAIYGAGYGGYAALAGLAFTPDLYACGIDYSGISNLMTYLETIPPNLESQRGMMYTMIGDPNKDREMLMKYSPALHAADIKAPVIIAQGANDPRVTLSELDQMVEVLNKSRVHVEYLVKEGEGHRFKADANRFEFYLTMEKFLKEHLALK